MSRSALIRAALSGSLSAALLAACERATPSPVVCLDRGESSIVVTVRTPDGTPAARGATLIIRDGTFADTALPASSVAGLQLFAGGGRPGTYDVEVTKPWYAPVLFSGVVAVGGPCGVESPTQLEITLVLLPAAPSVRTVVAYPPAMGLGAADLTVQMYAYVDAAAGIDTSVTWQISDSTVATLSLTGMLRSRCRTAPGEATIEARSVADQSQVGYAYVTVWRNAAVC
jgi:hypothetical protein